MSEIPIECVDPRRHVHLTESQSCIFCEKSQVDQKGLSGGENGRQKILDAAKILKDETGQRILNIPLTLFSTVKYHTKTCYANYIKKAERKRQKEGRESTICSSKNDNTEIETADLKRSKRVLASSTSLREPSNQ